MAAEQSTMPSIENRLAEFFDEFDEDFRSYGPNARWLVQDLEKLIKAGNRLDKEMDGAPNLLVSQCIFTGIEFIGRFYNHPLPDEVGVSDDIASLSNSKVGKFRDPKEHGRGDTATALEFIRDCFRDVYRDPLASGLSTTKAQAVWICFRHGHVHNYVQKQLKLPDGQVITGQVAWRRDGHLAIDATSQRTVFRVTVFDLFTDLEAGIANLRQKLSAPGPTGDDLRKRFAVAFDLWKRPHIVT
jgi:hypothetical protein